MEPLSGAKKSSGKFPVLREENVGRASPRQEPPAAPLHPDVVDVARNVVAASSKSVAPNPQLERVKDVAILRYNVPDFEKLSLQQKKLAYYLSQACLAGRDITYDQKYKYNVTIRRTLEAILQHYSGDRTSPDFQKLVEYTKRVWVSNGIHHHYSTHKFTPEFSQAFFESAVRSLKPSQLPLQRNETVDAFLARLGPPIFDPKVDAIGVNTDPNADKVRDSANNFYENLTQEEVEAFYKGKADPNDPEPPSWGLNSRLVKRNGTIVEQPWNTTGIYGPAISNIVFWLDKAQSVAENEMQAQTLAHLIRFFQTGELRAFDDANKAWVKDTTSDIDFVIGFIEVYGDTLGMRGTYEGIVQMRDPLATKRIASISSAAQWFEDKSPIKDEHKKAKVTGISARVISAVSEAGDAAPTTPIGINLPNADWIRKKYGSKSVTIGNIIDAYDAASAGSGSLEEFAFSPEEIARAKKYGGLSHVLEVDMHEVIGHASGQINNGVGDPSQTLKEYASTLEEARADLVALYYLPDPKLQELGVSPSADVGKAGYDAYIRGGLLTQMVRIEPGKNLEEAHMRNRQLIAAWAYEHGKADKVIEKVSKDGKTYFVVRDYQKLRTLFGELLREIQRIKSEGDYAAGKALVETYGVKLDQAVHQEVLARYAKLNIAPYSAFVQPELVPEIEDGEICDVKVTYATDFSEQMLRFAGNNSFLPNDPWQSA
jgi:dipeptidyl-peptidase III